jgi:hypothetical protein
MHRLQKCGRRHLTILESHNLARRLISEKCA